MEKNNMWKKIAGIFLSVFGIVGTVVTLATQWYVLAIVALVIAIPGMFFFGMYICDIIELTYTKKIDEYISSTNNEKERLASSLDNLQSTVENIKKEIINNHLEEIKNGLINKLNESTNFKFRTSETTRELEKYFDSDIRHKISKVKIICFGRNGYGDTIEYIVSQHPNIEIELIVCNPSKNKNICKAKDEDNIKRQIINASRNGHATIYASDVPPPIRAAIIYTKEKNYEGRYIDKAIWGIVEPYEFERTTSGFVLRRSETNGAALITVCDSRINTSDDFNGIINYIEREFNYLKSYSCEPKIINGEVDF